MASQPEQLILEFLDCWRRLDAEAAASHLAPGAVYQADPKAELVHGQGPIRTLWIGYMQRMRAYAADVRHLLASPQVVFLERSERLTLSDGREMAIEAVGVFELDGNGKITAWRDYWDTGAIAVTTGDS